MFVYDIPFFANFSVFLLVVGGYLSANIKLQENGKFENLHMYYKVPFLLIWNGQR